MRLFTIIGAICVVFITFIYIAISIPFIRRALKEETVKSIEKVITKWVDFDERLKKPRTARLFGSKNYARK